VAITKLCALARSPLYIKFIIIHFALTHAHIALAAYCSSRCFWFRSRARASRLPANFPPGKSEREKSFLYWRGVKMKALFYCIIGNGVDAMFAICKVKRFICINSVCNHTFSLLKLACKVDSYLVFKFGGHISLLLSCKTMCRE
jgi:hypothetical protein